MPKTTKKKPDVKGTVQYTGQLAGVSLKATSPSAPRIDLILVTQLAEWARQNDLSLTEALEEAVREFLLLRQPPLSMPQQSLQSFRDLINSLMNCAESLKKSQEEDAFLKALENIPEDDEPTTDEDRRCIEQALKEEEAGETITIEEVMKKHGR
jgi:hypothetical protein